MSIGVLGFFIARISRGHDPPVDTGHGAGATLVGFGWFSIFGGAALNFEIFHGVPLVEAVTADVSTAMFVMFNAMPITACSP